MANRRKFAASRSNYGSWKRSLKASSDIRLAAELAVPMAYLCSKTGGGAGTVVVVRVGAKHAAQMRFAENDQMVQALSSDRSYQPFNIGSVVQRLSTELPRIKTFATLSPVTCLTTGLVCISARASLPPQAAKPASL